MTETSTQTQSYVVPLPTLVVDPSSARINSFLSTLAPELDFTQIDSADSVFNALQACMGAKYSICFISNRMSTEDVQMLTNDINAMSGRGPMLLISLHDAEQPALTSEDLNRLGIALSFPIGPHAAEKIQLAAAIETFLNGPYKTGSDIDKYTEWMLKEIDRVYYDKKRGLPASLNEIFSDHIRQAMTRDITLSGTYFDALSNKAETVETPMDTTFPVPESVVKRELPKLESDGYKGVSNRVFTKLSKRFGNKKKAS